MEGDAPRVEAIASFGFHSLQEFHPTKVDRSADLPICRSTGSEVCRHRPCELWNTLGRYSFSPNSFIATAKSSVSSTAFFSLV